MSVSGRRLSLLVPAITLFLGVAFASLPVFGANATETITSRTLSISSSNSAGSNATTTYTFTFTVGNTSTKIQSVGIQFCTTADGTCTAPTGFDNSTGPAGLASQPVGLGDASGWTMEGTQPGTNYLNIQDTSDASNPSGTQTTIVFNKVQNPTTANQAFYARMTTYSDSFTTPIDNGVFAASTATQIVLQGTMPESLIFCTGQSISLDGNGNPICSTDTSDTITFNQDFSSTSTSYATSQFAASTNANSGYAISVTGPTLTNGGNTIPAMATGLSSIGTGQFGMNLALDSAANSASPAPSPASADITPSAGTYDKAEALTGYATGGDAATAQYTYNTSGNNVADSQTSATDPQLYTATYIVNVAGHQAAGTYQTTLTYICTPTF